MKNLDLFKKIKIISNSYRFEILELTSQREKTITELSKNLKLSYNSCADYIAILEKSNLIFKIKKGRNVYVKSNVNMEILRNELMSFTT